MTQYIIKIKNCLKITTYLLFILSLSGCCKFMVLDPKGAVAVQEKHILLICVLLMLMIVVPVIWLSFLFAFRYREKNQSAAYKPDWAHSTILEVVCWTVPCLIILILGFITWKTSHSLDPYKSIPVKDKAPITIQVVALEWKWLFIYPKQHIAAVNFMQVPVDVPVQFEITSEGPMNSFLIPQLGGQIYAMAGMQTKLNLVANTQGDYPGISANFSGRGFENMKFTARVSTQKEFDEWVKTTQQTKNVLTLAAYKVLAKPAETAVTYYSSVNKNIFKFIVMKAMMPEKEILYLCSGQGDS